MGKKKNGKKERKLTRIKTPVFRVSFPNVFNPESFDGEDKGKFSITMLFDEDTDLSALKKAAKKAAKEKWGKKLPKKLNSPFRDGAEKEGELDGYSEGMTFVRASSNRKPDVVDKQRNKLTEPEEFYPGCYAIATVNAFAYDTKGNKGVSFGLGNILKVDEGEPFGFASDPMDDFADDFDEDDEFDDDEDDDIDDDDEDEDDDW